MIKRLPILLFLLLCFPLYLGAQEKSDWYYIEHKEEILADIKSLFRKGEYDRVLDMCNLHNELLGEDHKEAAEVERLRRDARKCRELTADIKDHLADNDKDGAVVLAESLQEINPYDEMARLADRGVQNVQRNYDEEMRLAIKGGIGLAGIAQGTTGVLVDVGAGLLNIGDSRIGAEANVFFSPWLASSTVSMFGMDARLVIRATPSVYPNAGIGFFTCRSKEVTEVEATAGPCFPLGVSFVIGDGFIISATLCIFPEVRVWSRNTASAGGVRYNYLEPFTVAGGMVPRISVGYAF